MKKLIACTFAAGLLPAAWRVSGDGALTFLVPFGEVIKRLTVTPTAETSVKAMIAEAAEAPARAAAKAAEEKKKAAEAAAARKAKAEAEHEARLAKQKADYDAALAKRKADYAAALAKRKADYDAAVAARAEALKQQQTKK